MGSRRIGLGRPTPDDPDMLAQISALTGAGCTQLHLDRPSQPGNVRRLALSKAKPGDEILCLELRHLAQTIDDVAGFLAKAGERGVNVVELSSGFTTAEPLSHEAVERFHSAVSGFHGERTRRALASARQKGVRLGRLPAISPADLETIRSKIRSGVSITAIAEEYSTSRQTIYKYIKRIGTPGTSEVKTQSRRPRAKPGQYPAPHTSGKGSK